MNFLLIILLLSLTEFIGDSNFKFYARTDKSMYLFIGIIAYIFVVKFLIMALKQSNLLFVNMYWNGIESITETLLAYFILRERLTNWKQWLGFISISAGIFFLNSGKKPTD